MSPFSRACFFTMSRQTSENKVSWACLPERDMGEKEEISSVLKPQEYRSALIHEVPPLLREELSCPTLWTTAGQHPSLIPAAFRNPPAARRRWLNDAESQSSTSLYRICLDGECLVYIADKDMV